MPPDFDLNDPDAVAYCPSCGSGYTARAIRCAPCDTALVPRAEVEAAHRLDAEQSDEGHSALLSRVDEPIKANRLELELNQAGIPYLVQAWPLETLDFAGAPRFLEFRVPAKRLGEAREALQRVEETDAGSSATMPTPRRTLIRAGWIVAFDGWGHRLLRDGVVVLEGASILHVGKAFDGTADAILDARDRVVTPGFISTHAHIGGSPLDRSFIEDTGRPQFFYSGLFEMLPVRGAAQDEEAGRACVDFSMAELLRGGCTTVMELGGQGEYVVERAAHYGLRVYVGPMFRSGRWLTRDGRRVVWEWDEAAGREGLGRAIEFHARHDGAHGDLVRCFFAPSQIDTCTPELLREAKRCADERSRPFQVHVSQSVVEFLEMLGRHGTTPVAWMRELGLLGPRTILGHAIIVGGSSWTNYPPGDVALMGEAGCSVAHAPWVFVRRGVSLESFARYKAAGVNLSLGTDTNPQSLLEAMRWAAVVSKLVERNTGATTAADVFDAATLGGARALGRDDLGRIAPGAKADLVLWKAASWTMTPLRDPVKNLVYNATAEDADRVYVDGRLVVDGGRVLGADEAAILRALQAGGERMWPRMREADWAGRMADQLSPQTYPEWSP